MTTSGVRTRTVQTDRLNTFVREAGDPSAPVLVLVHGNVSSSVFFDALIEELSDTFRIIAPDYRGYGGSERKTIDATRGMADFSDDIAALLDTLEITEPVDLLGWSAGGNSVMQLAIDHPGRVRRLVLEAGGSPYGFGGTHGTDGIPTSEDVAGTGGGTANPEFCQRLAAGDRGEDQASPLTTLRSFYVRPGFTFEAEAEQRYLDGMLETSVGDDVYPGGSVPSPNWPGAGPSTTGTNNALSPKYLNQRAFADLDPAPPVLWIRGADDQIVSDTSLFDLAQLGKLGAIPGYPGEESCPPQPMVSQLRAVLEAAGTVTEVVYEDCGHSPHLEHPQRFADDVRNFLV